MKPESLHIRLYDGMLQEIIFFKKETEQALTIDIPLCAAVRMLINAGLKQVNEAKRIEKESLIKK